MAHRITGSFRFTRPLTVRVPWDEFRFKRFMRAAFFKKTKAFKPPARILKQPVYRSRPLIKSPLSLAQTVPKSFPFTKPSFQEVYSVLAAYYPPMMAFYLALPAIAVS